MLLGSQSGSSFGGYTALVPSCWLSYLPSPLASSSGWFKQWRGLDSYAATYIYIMIDIIHAMHVIFVFSISQGIPESYMFAASTLSAGSSRKKSTTAWVARRGWFCTAPRLLRISAFNSAYRGFYRRTWKGSGDIDMVFFCRVLLSVVRATDVAWFNCLLLSVLHGRCLLFAQAICLLDRRAHKHWRSFCHVWADGRSFMRAIGVWCSIFEQPAVVSSRTDFMLCRGFASTAVLLL